MEGGRGYGPKIHRDARIKSFIGQQTQPVRVGDGRCFVYDLMTCFYNRERQEQEDREAVDDLPLQAFDRHGPRRGGEPPFMASIPVRASRTVERSWCRHPQVK
jgi:hypothetical protein